MSKLGRFSVSTETTVKQENIHLLFVENNNNIDFQDITTGIVLPVCLW